ncbi:MAG: sigma-70 family RNA polymerase sigma factor [Marinilabiliaceae bacterium]|nr:sigma-70 family RNA polymerase sigma factor [Marinilabiliaceae bacterium]
MKNMQLLTDEQLVNGFVCGKEEYIDFLIDRHKNKVFTYILIQVKNKDLAEDIFQDTFCKVFQSLKEKKYIENGKFASWMMRIAHNLIIDHYRRNKNQSVISVDDNNNNIINNSLNHCERPVEEKIVYNQLLSEVSGLVDLLPKLQKDVIYMRHFQGLSFKEIAEETNVSINTALGRMRYAILNLRKIMEERKISLIV